MKKLTLSLLTAFAVASPSFAGTEVVSSKEYKQPVYMPPPCFKDQEFSMDLFYSFNDGRPGRYHYFRDGSGGGVGLNFFFARYIGISAEGNWWNGARAGWEHADGRSFSTGDNHHEVTHQVTGNLILRYPVEMDNFCFAPYIFGGGGGVFDGRSTGFADAGTGIEFRLTQHLGIFADWRWNFMGKYRNDVDTSRAGIRFVF